MSDDTDPSREASPGTTDARTRLAVAGALLGWWTLLALLLWVCFLRPEPRSLTATITWFSGPAPAPLALAALLAASGLELLRSERRTLGLAGLVCATLLVVANVLAALQQPGP